MVLLRGKRKCGRWILIEVTADRPTRIERKDSVRCIVVSMSGALMDKRHARGTVSRDGIWPEGKMVSRRRQPALLQLDGEIIIYIGG